jgi:multiple sugar transport system permease protein
MKKSQIALFLRDTLAVIIVGLFLFPIFWWGLNSIKPASALFDKDGIVFFDFVPSFVNYWVTFSGDGPGVYDARQAIVDTLIVALGSTTLVIGVGLFAAYALSRLSFRMKRYYIAWTIFQRFTPPIAIIIPIVSIFHTFGLFDTHVGLILMHTVMNLPIAILMLKSFFDDVPLEIDDAAMIDGASRVTLCSGSACR